MLRKFLGLLGIGTAKIDLILEKETYLPGEQVFGYYLIKGGVIGQQMKRIDCDLVKVDDEGKNEIIMDYTTILTTVHIQSQATNKIPFTFRLPSSNRMSGPLSYRFNTRLAFIEGAESLDQDTIRIIKK